MPRHKRRQVAGFVPLVAKQSVNAVFGIPNLPTPDGGTPRIVEVFQAGHINDLGLVPSAL